MSRAALRAIEAERLRRDAHWALFESGYFRTKDEHDLDDPVKPLPNLPYLRAMLDWLLVSGRLLAPAQATWALAAEPQALPRLLFAAQAGILFIEKSRQILATWLCCAYALWRAKSRPIQFILLQSKKEEDAANLVYNKDPATARISFMESRLPPHLRSIDFKTGAAYANLYFPNGSRIWGIPEGADIIRSNTPSLIVSDEACFQPEFGGAYTAALPAIKGGGQLVALSSAHPGDFAQLIEAV